MAGYGENDKPVGFGGYGKNDKPVDAVAPKLKDDRTFGETAKDYAASLNKGIGATVEMAGTGYGLLTGNMDNAARNKGAEFVERSQAAMSPYKQQHDADRDARLKKIEADDGKVSAYLASARATLTDPASLIEQVPQLVLGGGVGKVAKYAIGRFAGAKAGTKAGVAAAVGTNAGMAGADPAGDAYDRLLKLPDAQWQQNTDYQAALAENGGDVAAAKHAVALGLSRKVGAASSAVSLATSHIPGARAIEKSMVGGSTGVGGMLRSGATGFLGEAAQETTEEGFGVFSSNLAAKQVDPNQALDEGVAIAAGTGAGVGGAMGGIAGAASGYRSANPDEPTPTPVPRIAGHLPPPVETGTPSDQILQADVARANEMSAAQANADAIYGARDAYEASQAGQPDIPRAVVETPGPRGIVETVPPRAIIETPPPRAIIETAAKEQLGTGAIGRAASAGIDSGAVAPEQVLGIPAIAAGILPQPELTTSPTVSPPNSYRVSDTEAAPALETATASPTAGSAELTAGKSPVAPLTANKSEDITGEKLDKKWTEFDQASGTLGIDRAEMPQIKAEHRGAMVNFLNARGITSEQATVLPTDLKATQREFSPGKVEKAKGFTGNDRSILVSSDGHVLDGHHQWLAKRESGQPVKVIRLNAPIRELLTAVSEFPSAQTAAGATVQNGAANGTADAAPAALAQAGGEVRSDNGVPRAPDALVLPEGRGVGDAAAGTGAGSRVDLPAGHADRNDAVAAPSVVLQNRDRSQPESIAQMRGIAANPDPSRLSFSRDAGNGAPVVFGDLPQSAVLGKTDHIVSASGRKMAVQYAAVDAQDLIASNDVNGMAVADYANGVAGKLRAVGGNGRVAGLQESHRLNAAGSYTAGIIEDAGLHGVADMGSLKNPVLVRVMRNEDVTPTIGDEFNVRSNMGLSAVEQAKTDAARVKLETLDFTDSGDVTQDAIKAFVLSMPESERNELMDGGRVGSKAVDRMMAAIFWQAYGDAELVRIFAQAQDIESKAVITALAGAAPAMARLVDAGNLDIRSIVADAAKVAVNASREGVALSKLAKQGDFELGHEVMAVVQFMADNIRKPRVIAEHLTDAANFAYGMANQSTEDMFGGAPVSRDDIIRRVANDFQGRQENLAEQGGRQSDAGNAGNQAADQGGRSDNQAAEAGRPDYGLQGQTNAQINAEAEAAKKEAEKAEREANMATGPDVTADQVDMFNTQGGLFGSNRDEANAEFTHSGYAIKPIKVRIGDALENRWNLQNEDNRLRALKGEREIGGDSLHKTREAAIAEAERQSVRAEQDRKLAAERKAGEDASKAKEQERIESNRGLSIVERKANSTLNKDVRIDGKVMTLREAVEMLVARGEELTTEEEPKIKPMSRREFNRADNRQQESHEKRMKEAGNKTVYYIGGYDLGKTAYDYALTLQQGKPTPTPLTNEADKESQLTDPKQSALSALKPAASLTITIERTVDGKTVSKTVNARKALAAAQANVDKYEALKRCMA